MSLDGGYIGSLDHAIANLHVGRQQGYDEGRQYGFDEGRQYGFEEGRQAGFSEGWNKAVDEANDRINEQKLFTQQHIDEKQRVCEENALQRQHIEQLNARVAELERENASLRPGGDIRSHIDQLSDAKAHLQESLAAANAQYMEERKKCDDQIWQYNRALVFLNAARSVLEDQISRSTLEESVKLSQMFATRYANGVSQALATGGLLAPPEDDEVFATKLPRTREFIMKMLDAAHGEPEYEEDSAPPGL